MLHVALKIHLSFLTVRRGRQSYEAENSGADAFSDRANGATFAGSVATFKNDNHAKPFIFDPILKLAELHL